MTRTAVTSVQHQAFSIRRPAIDGQQLHCSPATGVSRIRIPEGRTPANYEFPRVLLPQTRDYQNSTPIQDAPARIRLAANSTCTLYPRVTPGRDSRTGRDAWIGWDSHPNAEGKPETVLKVGRWRPKTCARPSSHSCAARTERMFFCCSYLRSDAGAEIVGGSPCQAILFFSAVHRHQYSKRNLCHLLLRAKRL